MMISSPRTGQGDGRVSEAREVIARKLWEFEAPEPCKDWDQWACSGDQEIMRELSDSILMALKEAGWVVVKEAETTWDRPEEYLR